MRFAVRSDRGIIRNINEDSYNIIAGYPGIPVAFMIADGMGGHNSGEVASKLAVDFIGNYIMQYPEHLLSDAGIEDNIIDLIGRANKFIYETSKENETYSGMGTTLILAIVGGKRLVVGHIGDSRLYVVETGTVNQLTKDHSFIEELLRNGSISREEADNHPQKNVITRALGCYEDIEVDTYTYNFHDGDVFVICTDGLSNKLTGDEIMNIVTEFDDPETACEELVKKANERGGEDNVTVIVAKID